MVSWDFHTECGGYSIVEFAGTIIAGNHPADGAADNNFLSAVLSFCIDLGQLDHLGSAL